GFARELAAGCDLYVNDAFGSAHRAHASTVGVAQLLPAYAGLLLLAELEHLAKLLGEVEHPFVLVSGGAKVDDKVGVLQKLGGRADTVLVGGKMAEQLRVENPLGFDVELPTDVVGAAAFEEEADSGTYPFDSLPDGWLGLDIGPETRDRFAHAIAGARAIVAGNWKMFAGPEPRALADRLSALERVDAIVAPPYTSLVPCVEAGLVTYAQNVHWEPEGPFTGEVSPPMLLALGVRGAIVGHSERRQFFCENDTGVARRASAALEAGLGVIACVGETREERDAGATETVLRVQVQAIGDACGMHDRIVLAYEPVWAIGTGLTATPELAQEAHAFIKSLLDRPVLYGGSVKPDNAAELLAQPAVDGALVGGASLEIDRKSVVEGM